MSQKLKFWNYGIDYVFGKEHHKNEKQSSEIRLLLKFMSTCNIMGTFNSYYFSKQISLVLHWQLYASYHIIDYLSFFLLGERAHMMEQKHGQQFWVQPLLLRASDNGRLSKPNDTEWRMNAQNTPKVENEKINETTPKKTKYIALLLCSINGTHLPC